MGSIFAVETSPGPAQASIVEGIRWLAGILRACSLRLAGEVARSFMILLVLCPMRQLRSTLGPKDFGLPDVAVPACAVESSVLEVAETEY